MSISSMNNHLTAYPTTDLSDANPDACDWVSLPFADYGKKRCFAGRIHTFLTVEDTKKVQDELFALPGEGGVIVIDGGGSLRTAMMGDRMAERLVNNGWAGVVINGAIRDSGALVDANLGIKALGVTVRRSGKHGSGAIDLPLAFGGVYFEPGMCLYADEDGVLVSHEPLVTQS